MEDDCSFEEQVANRTVAVHRFWPSCPLLELFTTQKLYFMKRKLHHICLKTYQTFNSFTQGHTLGGECNKSHIIFIFLWHSAFWCVKNSARVSRSYILNVLIWADCMNIYGYQDYEKETEYLIYVLVDVLTDE